MKKPDSRPSPVRVRTSVFTRTWPFLLALLSLGALQVSAQNTVLTNTWTVTASTSSYLNTTNHLTRGMAYNPVTGHLLVASRSPMPTVTNAIYILDSATGNTLGTLPFDSTLITGGTFPINMVGVTTDGVIYVGNLTTDTTNAAAGPFRLYRWASETASPTLAYSGDPSSVGLIGASPRRYGDSIAIRGTGATTQILLGTLNHTVALLTTTDGNNFTAQKIVTDGEAADTRWGLVWGAGDTFWAKQSGKNLKRYSLNIAEGKATVTDSILLPSTPGSLIGVAGGPMDIDLSRNLLAIVDAANHKLRVYDISNPLNPVQTDYTKDMPASNANGNFVGAVYMKNGLLFALETNNGIRAYTLHEGVILPLVMGAQPVSAPSSLWEGAYWKLASGAYGTQLSYQWQKNGADVPGLTNSSITFNVGLADAGSYRLVISNPSGSVTSSVATIPTAKIGNRTAQMTNLWNVAPLTRQYLGTNHNEYGVAINPVNNNVLVLARGSSNLLAVLDPNTGAEKYYIDYSPLLPLPSGWNKVDVADDGTVYLCNLSANTTSNPFRVDALLSDNQFPTASEVGRALYSGDPGGGQTVPEVTWGITFSVRGTRDNAQILLGSGAWNQSSKTFSILQSDSSGMFVANPITVSDAPDKFGRLGLDWGPSTNTVWAKSTDKLLLIKFDLAAGTGTVEKSYPLTGNRSVPANVTGIKYDPTLKLLAGNLNAGTPVPVSVPVYNISNPDLGPLWVDQELYNTYYPEVNFQGTVDIANNYVVSLSGNNGVTAFKIDPAFVPLPVIVTQPVGGTWFENTSSPTITVAADANAPITYQWYKGTEPLAGKVAETLTIPNITAEQAGDYWVRVTAGGASIDSQIATMVVIPITATAQMTNIWNVLPGTRDYLNTYYFEYGMAFNPATSNLVVASCIMTNVDRPVVIGVMDALTGAHKHTLNTDPIPRDAGINRFVNKVGVSDDGVVYIANRTTSPATAPLFAVYRWENDAPTTVPSAAFTGDPFATLITTSSKNIGFTMDVRGAGANTEILLSTASSNVVSILTTTDGQTFTAKELLVPGVPNSFGRLGICWGPGNTFWAKAWQSDGGQLRQVSYDLAAQTAEVVRTYDTTKVAATMTTIAYNDSLKFLAGIARDDQKNLMLYGLGDLEKGPELLDQEVFPSYYPSIEANGAVDFGGNTYLFGMNENNGVIAMLINPDYVPPATEFKVLSATLSGNTITITWESKAGVSYQVQQKSEMNGTWQDLGNAVNATGATATFSETVSAGARFYRIKTQ